VVARLVTLKGTPFRFQPFFFFQSDRRGPGVSLGLGRTGLISLRLKGGIRYRIPDGLDRYLSFLFFSRWFEMRLFFHFCVRLRY